MSDKEVVEVGMEAIKSPDVSILTAEGDEDIDDGSSIEALQWSDFDEEEVEAARQFAAREFPNDGPAGSAGVTKDEDQQVPKVDESVTESKSEIMTESQESVVSTVTTVDSEGRNEEEEEEEEEDSPATIISAASSQEEFQNIEYPAEDDVDSGEGVEDVELVQTNDDQSGSMLSIPSGFSREDSASTAPVLDDGPIWGKGKKLYRFHENRTINQKLTFGVLISVVLAIGIGLGNLVAYNEYEGEHHTSHKIEHFHCPASRSPLADNRKDASVTTNGFPSSTHIKHDNGEPEGDLRNTRFSAQNDRYNVLQQQDALAYVVKSIDELSKKLDHFENTTRQLGGIIVMSEEARLLSRKDAPRRDDMKPTFSNEDLSQWKTPQDRPVKFSEVVHSDQGAIAPEAPEIIVPAESASATVKELEEDLDADEVTVETETPGTALPEIIVVNISPKEEPAVLKDDNVQSYAKNEHYKRAKSPAKENFKRGHSDPREQLSSQDFPRENFRRERSPKPNGGKWDPPRQYDQREKSRHPENFQRERSPHKDFKRQPYPNPRENFRRENSPPREWEHYRRENSPPRNDIKKEKSPPREEFRRAASVPRMHQNDKRGKSPPRSDDRPLPPPESQRNKQRVDNYPPKVIYVPDDEPWREDKENNGKHNKKAKKNKKNGDNDFQQPKPKKYKNKQKQYEDKIVRTDSDPAFKQPQYGPLPADWDLVRAKARENQRVQQNWNNDFQPPERQRKRQQQHNWQIERDRVREKFRKGVQA